MVEINNLTSYRISKKKIKRIAEEVLKREKATVDLSVVFLVPKEIKKINKKYRNKDQATDVLSFNYEKEKGEIVICPDIVKKNAKKYNLSYNKELVRVLIHGILHILGYKHKNKKEAEKMKEKEKYYQNRD